MLASGLPIGKSLAEADLVDEARAVMSAMKARGAPYRWRSGPLSFVASAPPMVASSKADSIGRN